MTDKYIGYDNYGKPKADFLLTVAEMTATELEEKTEQAIWLSACANNNPRSDYHWQVDACHDECARRDPDMYERAYRKAYRSTTGKDPGE